MSQTSRIARPQLVVGAILLLGAAFAPDRARADRITLRGGGQVKGKLVPDKAHPDRWLLLGETGRTPMALTRDQVLQVSPEKGPMDEYIVLRDADRPTAEAEYQLGVWCEEHKLVDLAQVHFDATVKRDSTFEAAHRKLGHVQMDGRWLNSDEVKEAQGLVKYRGRWVTVEEKERKEAQAATLAEGASWARRIGLLRDAYLAGPSDRAREAEARLLAISEPIAVGPVLRVMGEDPIPTLRILAARMLASIPGPEASSGLARRLLAEEDDHVRRMTMEVLARRDGLEVVPILTRALRSTRHEIVNRAAWALSYLDAVGAVPRLVPALITVEYQVVMTGGGGSGSPGISFNAVPPGPVGGYSQSIPVLTPPAVGSGSVAFGATSVPSGAFGGTSLGTGGGSRGPVPRLVPVEHRNGEVLAALVKMTGRDFGYDIPTWKRWVATSFRIDAPPTRRVRQP